MSCLFWLTITACSLEIKSFPFLNLKFVWEISLTGIKSAMIKHVLLHEVLPAQLPTSNSISYHILPNTSSLLLQILLPYLSHLHFFQPPCICFLRQTIPQFCFIESERLANLLAVRTCSQIFYTLSNYATSKRLLQVPGSRNQLTVHFIIIVRRNLF